MTFVCFFFCVRGVGFFENAEYFSSHLVHSSLISYFSLSVATIPLLRCYLVLLSWLVMSASCIHPFTVIFQILKEDFLFHPFLPLRLSTFPATTDTFISNQDNVPYGGSEGTWGLPGEGAPRCRGMLRDGSGECPLQLTLPLSIVFLSMSISRVDACMQVKRRWL